MSNSTLTVCKEDGAPCERRPIYNMLLYIYCITHCNTNIILFDTPTPLRTRNRQIYPHRFFNL